MICNIGESRYITDTALQLQRATAATPDIILDESGVTLNSASIQSNHQGYEGTGFIDYGNEGSYALWQTDIATSGTYDITIRYASRNSRPLHVFFDDVKVGEFAIDATNDWATWREETITVQLSSGNNQEVKILAAVNPGPNVDNLTISLSGSNPGTGDDDNDAVYKVVLNPNDNLVQQDYMMNEPGTYEVGITGSGDLVVRTVRTSTIVWSLESAVGENLDGIKMWMQGDGNLVLRGVPTDQNPNGKAEWSSKTYGNSGAYFGINQSGGIAVILSDQILWQGGPQSNTPSPTSANPPPTPFPTPATAPPPTPLPTSKLPTNGPPIMPRNMPSGKVLGPNDSMERGEFTTSPNGQYQIGLNDNGMLVMLEGTREVWRLQDKDKNDIVGIFRAFMQSDGNLVLRDTSLRALWNSETSNNAGSTLEIDNGGQVSVVFQGTVLWLDGIPRGFYTGASPRNLELAFPVRGMFYYAW
jgi:hypothetical protein